MQMITVDGGDRSDGGCTTCCCEVRHISPGETDRLLLNYAPWAVPIAPRGLCCTPSIEVEEKQTCPPPTGTNLPPDMAAQRVSYDVPVNGHLDGDLRGVAVDPEGTVLTFKLLPMYGPLHGKLVLDPTGMFDYDPISNYKGEDRFWVRASDGVGHVVFEVMIGVGIPSINMVSTPDLSVGQPIINDRHYTVSLSVSASPAARTCQVFRLNIRQGAVDCDYNQYYNIACVDMRVVKC